ncbi:glutathione peroxidase-like thioredoxin peroxidase [Plasmodium brasilianum]|uniref:Glutathione peroxidase n=2 Tax=Plasmodium (Plasmodium) TaxID=418103 RepID=A0A1A8WWS7_PLAMA|nr:glutathione peroxidase-like thioredoxin peroxidase, putative [Plasmodium malariae]KAI4835644.1 glutathione peroxidase-like thioredoxin peroxidase [Plasmodium brasilianum]SBS96337.1 glutathione peroxidase-like thioredoxin peroxidase, putative [Plasmodium malariae]SCP02573.1 glutathione peroxidase-like thioredoxin peroxidase, putative [Plasmodium malariae]
MKILLFIKVTLALLILQRNISSMFGFFKKITISKGDLRPTLYDYDVKSLDGKTISMSTYKNKVLVIFNSASKCGLTSSQIEQFNQLYERLQAKGLELLAFPTYQFLNQEYQNVCDIRAFNEKKNVKYSTFAPVEVNGENTNDLFKFLKANCESMHDKNGKLENIGWNFGKFLVDRKGNVVKYFSPRTSPLDMEKFIVELL